MKVDHVKPKVENWKSLTSHLSPLTSIIQLEMGHRDYSLAQIARIVEEEDAKIIGLAIDSLPEDPDRIVVSILLNKSDCIGITQSFYRYNYNVLNTFSSPEENSDLMDRYSLLMRYLNV